MWFAVGQELVYTGCDLLPGLPGFNPGTGFFNPGTASKNRTLPGSDFNPGTGFCQKSHDIDFSEFQINANLCSNEYIKNGKKDLQSTTDICVFMYDYCYC
jgi:hypothetical protein